MGLRQLSASLLLTGVLATPAAMLGEEAHTLRELVSSVPEGIPQSVLDKIGEKINPSVVCIRGVPAYRSIGLNPLPPTLPIDTLTISAYHGTGFVYDTEVVNGKTEYIILTNRHVGAPDLVGPAGIFESNNLMIVENANDRNEKDATKLELISQAPDYDWAILRTKDAKRPLSVYHANLGLPKKTLGLSDTVITYGYPLGQSKIMTGGTITSMKFPDVTLTSSPMNAYLANLLVDPGQSGSPVFAVTTKKENKKIAVDVSLIGLVYAGSPQAQTLKMITPVEPVMEMIRTRQDLPSKRPRLDAPIDDKKVKSILTERSTNYIDSFGRRFSFTPTPDGLIVKEAKVTNNNVINSEYTETKMTTGSDRLKVETITDTKDGEATTVRDVAQIPEPLQEVYAKFYTGLLNNFMHNAEYQRLQSKRNADVETSLQRQFYGSLVATEQKTLQPTWLALHTDLWRQKVISNDFW